MINILHLSDVHFPSENFAITERELKYGIINFLNSIDDNQVYLLISGDITLKGEKKGYQEAYMFFEDIIKGTNGKIHKDNILLCPGNHDIVKESYFKDFNEFSYKLRNDNAFLYGVHSSVTSLQKENVFFLGINSVYHLNHEYGLVNIDDIEYVLKNASISPLTRKIAFTHHHLINQFVKDTSSIRNAHQLLLLLDHYGFEAIFHGHQHTSTKLVLGESNMITVGVSTPGLEMQGYTNGFNYYSINEKDIKIDKYIYSRDAHVSGKTGNFIKLPYIF
ncbi:metallophosphoesterase [Exiguobacterium sp. HVEsp1]|uniref:metallophosphoesterase family protein n=1 Tax=Exiguobacterium sp. HVEsp1 TaxID=1934003 RepID=UPI0014398E63|nr:metallophosphoesterase [Exiguobacterium sp. HVEsp1]